MRQVAHNTAYNLCLTLVSVKTAAACVTVATGRSREHPQTWRMRPGSPADNTHCAITTIVKAEAEMETSTLDSEDNRHSQRAHQKPGVAAVRTRQLASPPARFLALLQFENLLPGAAIPG